MRALQPAPKPKTLFGLNFPNPVGLAAGFDKNGVALPAWAALGFGFIEIGTVTAQPAAGESEAAHFSLSRAGSADQPARFQQRRRGRRRGRLASCGRAVAGRKFRSASTSANRRSRRSKKHPRIIFYSSDAYMISPTTSRSMSVRRTLRACATCSRKRRSRNCCARLTRKTKSPANRSAKNCPRPPLPGSRRSSRRAKKRDRRNHRDQHHAGSFRIPGAPIKWAV